MSTRLLRLGLLFLLVGTSGCCWCHRRHCFYASPEGAPPPFARIDQPAR